MTVIYKVVNEKGMMTLVPYLDELKHELIEEIECPDEDDPEEACQLLLEEVFLGNMCESRTRY